MFGLLDLFAKQVNDQIAQYAAAQSDIVHRLWSTWFDPFHACQPVKVRIDRRPRGGAVNREASHHS